LDATDAKLMRLGENAVYSLSSTPIVVRIARSMRSLDDASKEIRVAQWLQEADYPAARLADISNKAGTPLVVDEHPISFWQHIDSSGASPTSADLGRLLHQLHALKLPSWLELPSFDPFAKVERRLQKAPASIDREEISFLSSLLEKLRCELAVLDFSFPLGAVHGDAHPGNLMCTDAGDVVLIDFEAFCFGPREWDLSLSAAYRYGFDWLTAEDYTSFVEAYGFDVTQWPGFPVLRAIRELGMTTWLMQLVETDRRIEEEFSQRISDLLTGEMPRRWNPF